MFKTQFCEIKFPLGANKVKVQVQVKEGFKEIDPICGTDSQNVLTMYFIYNEKNACNLSRNVTTFKNKVLKESYKTCNTTEEIGLPWCYTSSIP